MSTNQNQQCLCMAVLMFMGIAVGAANTRAEEATESLLADVADAWGAQIPVESLAREEQLEEHLQQPSGEILPVQMLAPQTRSGSRVAQRPRRTAAASGRSGSASVPFMIGDTGAGSCVSFGGLLDVDLGHPTLGCSRLNISEGNTPLPTDRVYFSYRHFENATPTRVFQVENSHNIDRFLLAGERTFFDQMMSAEIRVPIEGRLNSDTETYIVNPASTLFTPPGFVPLIGEGGSNVRRTELANMSLIFKALMYERNDLAVTTGLGVTMPTARDVTYSTAIDELVTFTDFPGLLAQYSIRLDATATNETFYLSPFMAWLWQPEKNWFHQGFLQVEVAANPSKVIAAGGGVSTFDTSGNGIVDPFDPLDTVLEWSTPLPLGAGDLKPQTLLRLNLGWGYVLADNPASSWAQKLTALFEVHYTTTLNDANVSSIPLVIVGPGFGGLDSIDIGNRNNRVDIINLVTGLSANMNGWVVTNGVAAPLKKGSNRGFDFEYNLQIQRPF